MPCPNTAGGAHELPLVRQTWLAKKKGRYVALQAGRRPRGAVAVAGRSSRPPIGRGARLRPGRLLEPRARRAAWSAAPPSTPSTSRQHGLAGQMGITPLAAVVVKPSGRGRDYLPVGTLPAAVGRGVRGGAGGAGRDAAGGADPAPTTRRNFWTPLYGLTRFRDLFTPRQLATLCAFAQGVREAHAEMIADGMEPQRAEAVCAYLGLALDRVVDREQHSVPLGYTSEPVADQHVCAPGAADGLGFRGSKSVRRRRSGRPLEYVENIADIVEQHSRAPAGESSATAPQPRSSPTTTAPSTRSSPTRRTTTTSPTPTYRISSTSG